MRSLDDQLGCRGIAANRLANTRVLVLIVLLVVSCTLSAYANFQIDIKMGSTTITNTTTTVIVGQDINLTGVVTGGTPTAHQWVIGGDPIYGYFVTSERAFVSEILATSYTQQDISFRWVNGGTFQVDYKPTINGTQYTATATFNVLRPSSTVTVTSVVDPSVDQNCGGGWAGHFGCGSGFPGIRGFNCTRTFTVPQPFSGVTQWVQVVNSSHIEYHNRLTFETCEVNASGQDTYYPNSSGASWSDAPLSGLSSDWTVASRSDSFTTYLMFKPTGGGIWVPLKKVDWTWSFDATSDFFQWAGSGTKSVPSTGSDCTDEPLWGNNIIPLPDPTCT